MVAESNFFCQSLVFLDNIPPSSHHLLNDGWFHNFLRYCLSLKYQTRQPSLTFFFPSGFSTFKVVCISQGSPSRMMRKVGANWNWFGPQRSQCLEFLNFVEKLCSWQIIAKVSSENSKKPKDFRYWIGYREGCAYILAKDFSNAITKPVCLKLIPFDY